MSLQTYNQTLFYDDRQYDKSNDSITPAQPTDGVALEFQMDLVALKGGDKMSKRSTGFTVVGETEYSPAVFGALCEAGARIGAKLAKMSKGKVSGFYVKMGKYRSDEVPTVIYSGDSSYAIIDLTNNENDAYGNNPCTNAGVFPVNHFAQRIFIPWVRDDISRQDIKQTIENCEETIDGVTYTLGQVRFTDEMKDALECGPTCEVRNTKILEYSAKTPTFIANNDSAEGISSDSVLSESTAILSTGRDDGELNQ